MATTNGTHTSNSSKIILLTGINGYIASHIALQLLQKGYTVRGTSRSPDTPARLLANPAFKSIDPSLLQHRTIPDITLQGAFSDAIQDVHAIIHTASPVNFNLKTVDEFFGPAIGGVTSLLGTAYGENLRRGPADGIVSFVLTSSVSAVGDKWRFPPISMGGTENHAYTEADWNTSGEKVARDSETSGPFLPLVAYGASKAAAEKAMWNYVEEMKSIGKDAEWKGPACSAICPGVVTGPPANWPDRPEKLNETLAPVWDIWSGKSKKEGKLPPQIGAATYIDVRDVAALHIWCMEHPEQSGGERYLVTNGKAPPQATADVLRDVLFKKDEKVRERIFVGEPGAGYVKGFGWPDDEPTAKATKAYNAMGVEKFRGFDDSVLDTVMAFRERWPEYGY